MSKPSQKPFTEEELKEFLGKFKIGDKYEGVRLAPAVMKEIDPLITDAKERAIWVQGIGSIRCSVLSAIHPRYSHPEAEEVLFCSPGVWTKFCELMERVCPPGHPKEAETMKIINGK